MLLNEFLKEHRKVQELESTVAKQEARAAKQHASIAWQQQQIETLAAGLQKVNAELELSKAILQMTCLPRACSKTPQSDFTTPAIISTSRRID